MGIAEAQKRYEERTKIWYKRKSAWHKIPFVVNIEKEQKIKHKKIKEWIV
jgi:hypothetical protein